jgi:hypothetical protein
MFRQNDLCNVESCGVNNSCRPEPNTVYCRLVSMSFVLRDTLHAFGAVEGLRTATRYVCIPRRVFSTCPDHQTR